MSPHRAKGKRLSLILCSVQVKDHESSNEPISHEHCNTLHYLTHRDYTYNRFTIHERVQNRKHKNTLPIQYAHAKKRGYHKHEKRKASSNHIANRTFNVTITHSQSFVRDPDFLQADCVLVRSRYYAKVRGLLTEQSNWG